MSEFTRTMTMLQKPLPLVTLKVTCTGATWFGKWCLNTSTESVIALGGPWDTEEEACAAVMATGRYTRRAGTQSPHFDRI